MTHEYSMTEGGYIHPKDVADVATGRMDYKGIYLRPNDVDALVSNATIGGRISRMHQSLLRNVCVLLGTENVGGREAINRLTLRERIEVAFDPKDESAKEILHRLDSLEPFA